MAEAFRKQSTTLDISKAYDMSWRYTIIEKFKNWKIENFM
jgi:hypothetical protein